jgi:hypothetical protein
MAPTEKSEAEIKNERGELMKKILNILRRIYIKFCDTRGELDLSKHRTKPKPIELYRVRKMPAAIEKYEEIQIGKTLYRVTSTFTGEIDLKNVLEELTVKKVLQSEEIYGKTKGIQSRNLRSFE